jgi:hypothetical protein
MSSKKWFLGACGALLIGGLAMNANAMFTVDFKAVSLNGLALTDSKNVLLGGVGDKVSVEIWVTVQGLDAVADEGYASVTGALISYAPGGPTVGLGKFVPTGTMRFDENFNEIGPAWWNEPLGGGNGSTMGAEHNLAYDTVFGNMPDDGSPDFGSPTFLDVSTEGGWISIRGLQAYGKGGASPAPLISAGLAKVISTPNPRGLSFKVGQFDWELTQIQFGGRTELNWMPRVDATASGNIVSSVAAIYVDDNASINPQTGGLDPSGMPLKFGIGAPIVLTTIPEPASLSVLALGALGLLARRRK